jgi:hypothetical protein
MDGKARCISHILTRSVRTSFGFGSKVRFERAVGLATPIHRGRPIINEGLDQSHNV